MYYRQTQFCLTSILLNFKQNRNKTVNITYRCCSVLELYNVYEIFKLFCCCSTVTILFFFLSNTAKINQRTLNNMFCSNVGTVFYKIRFCLQLLKIQLNKIEVWLYMYDGIILLLSDLRDIYFKKITLGGYRILLFHFYYFF